MNPKKRMLVFGLAMILALSFASLAVAADKPKFKVYKKIVDFAVVKQIVDGKKKGFIIDARPQRPKYNKGHIPGALSQPWSKFKRNKVNAMPKDKGAFLVFYCGGPT